MIMRSLLLRYGIRRKPRIPCRKPPPKPKSTRRNLDIVKKANVAPTLLHP